MDNENTIERSFAPDGSVEHHVAQRIAGEPTVWAILPIKGKGESGWAYSWVPVAGPMAGAVLAALTYMVLF